MKIFNLKKTFAGGVHPKEEKNLTENCAFEIMPLPKQIFIPLNQHIGKPAKALVKKGSIVKTGEVIAEAAGFMSSVIHSSVTGKVNALVTFAHASGTPKEAIQIIPSAEEELVRMDPLDPSTATPEEIKERVRNAGLVGQGGAAFPTFIKLSPPDARKIDYFLLNGAECEPYLTRDYRLMIERPEDVINGLLLLMKAAGVERSVIGIENNKPLAAEKLGKAAEEITKDMALSVQIHVLPTKYPQGAEKMLIKVITGRTVPIGKLPFDVGVIVQNIGTAISVFDAVVKGEPQTTCALTVTGRGIAQSKNLIVRVGTPLQEILDYCGGLLPDARKVIIGGPMMGAAQYDLNVPVMKAASGIVVLSASEIEEMEETSCLRCGKCIGVCPFHLMPVKISRFAQLERYEDAEQFGITACMECGTCAYECPANIPLVQWIKLGKLKVLKIQREKQAG